MTGSSCVCWLNKGTILVPLDALEDENELTDDAAELTVDDILLARLDDWPASELLCDEVEFANELDEGGITVTLLTALELLRVELELLSALDDMEEDGVDVASDDDCEITHPELRELFS